MAKCVSCENEVVPVEMGLTKKLMGKGVTNYYCFSCLAKEFNTSVEKLKEVVKEYQRQGCSLFPKLED